MKNGKLALDAKVVSSVLVSICRFLTGIRAKQTSPIAKDTPCIYYANHSSHLDGLVIWSCLSPNIRPYVHPVAAEDYWNKNRLRRYLSRRIFRAILIPRHAAKMNFPQEENSGEEIIEQPTNDSASSTPNKVNALALMQEILDQGDSLIIFPEGTRGNGESIQDFKAGLWHLSRKNPNVQLVPIYLENLNRVLPKGSRLVVPVICSAIFGAPIGSTHENESKQEFLVRAKSALEELHNGTY
ncbi:lysophospholipid acyltransferase family protein [Proteus terrae]|uniref:lysophospholipid acyltransferase family protein n=1 Tax=Proteus terrae TaxID=1574161 RepID=UPI000BFB6F85|nr:lysophospholipid acyltransferase family protein [Proteus terrae]ATM99672.1 1-acyl-sn-glycerol-3-phosphate acyltransferase [Proteus vulgaris]MBG2836475.1 1-acyl-sn-glycerol-3-phosphate acyltransferase [Proteus terrae subsp. cibarius]MBG2869521.1 1-acyl-sn-glycerol-3-phosphate acyltransferase [Proteus terrae subsp. cibarius]MBJ2110232.1 1-acyl-sn-glycerol-3-phosphate acyltransferase [Proteus terrae]MBJ2134160.1 1-acyl-sn-glycerol-3-phosphate acyltransferase [Proteus terrae]